MTALVLGVLSIVAAGVAGAKWQDWPASRVLVALPVLWVVLPIIELPLGAVEPILWQLLSDQLSIPLGYGSVLSMWLEAAQYAGTALVSVMLASSLEADRA